MSGARDNPCWWLPEIDQGREVETIGFGASWKVDIDPMEADILPNEELVSEKPNRFPLLPARESAA
jgi:hypothetical protein